MNFRRKLSSLWKSERSTDSGADRGTSLEMCVRSGTFEGFFSFVILVNCISMGAEADALVRDSPREMIQTLDIMEHVFTALFTAELILRIRVYGYRVFLPNKVANLGNFMDVILVFFTGILFGWAVPLLGPLVGISPDGGVVRTLTVFRAIRLLRVVRVIQKAKLFREVWLLLRGLMDSIRTLFWTCIVIFFITYIFAVFGLWLIGHSIKQFYDAAVDKEEQKQLAEVLTWIGGLGPFTRTLLQFLTLDSWNSKMEPIMEFLPWCWAYFYAYISVAVFVLMNLVTAIIVENAMTTARLDEDHQVKQKEAIKQQELLELRNLFLMMDADGDGTLDWEEFKAAFSDPQMSKKWKLLDFSPDDCLEIFQLLDDGDGGIDTNEFFSGLARMKGTAQSKDLVRLSKTVDRLSANVSAISQLLGGRPCSPTSRSLARDSSL